MRERRKEEKKQEKNKLLKSTEKLTKQVYFIKIVLNIQKGSS
jgi:hypothetical protein